MSKYDFKNGIAYRKSSGEEEMMANFTALITKQTRYIGGITSTRTYTIEGERLNPDGGDPIPLPEITIDDTEFVAMGWPLKYWGVECILMPGQGIAADMRTAIQLLSRAATAAIYKQTGWVNLEGGVRAYLHRDGAITAKGNDATVSVELPTELKYSLTCGAPVKDSIAATLQLATLADASLTWPLLAGALAPMYGPCDFAIHVTGRTGSFKSEVMSLFQSLYGPGFDARHLPGSWSSSDNALEALAFLAANAVFTIDDFVPHGSAWQQRTYQGKAERIFRAQGNQSGRQRMTDVSGMQQTMYPRGVVFSTGEDTPEGHSVRGRMIIREIKPGDVAADTLSAAQANRPLYCGTIAWLAQSLAASPVNLDARAAELRDQHKDVGHSRTPSTLGRLIAVAEDFLQRITDAKLINEKQRKGWMSEALAGIIQAGEEQEAFLMATDPVDVFLNTLKQAFAGGQAHCRSINDGVPINATQLGWTSEKATDEVTGYKAHGICIGWSAPRKNELYIEPNAAIMLAKKIAGPEIPLSKVTLVKRIGESGRLNRSDAARKRYTVRVQVNGAMREVLAFKLNDILGTDETVA